MSGARTSRSADVVLVIGSRRAGIYVRFSRFPPLRSSTAVITSRRTRRGALVVRMRIRGRSVRPVLQRAYRFPGPSPTPPAPTPPPVPASPATDGPFEVTECGDATPLAGAPASAFDAMWRRSGAGWTGGDGTYSVPLPDGRILWLFGDTFLGGVTATGARAADSVMVNNAFVVQDGRCLTTLAGGTRQHPAAMVGTGVSGSWYWPAGARVSGSTLTVALWRFTRTGIGMWDWRFDGSTLAFFSLPDLRLRNVVGLPGGARVAWGVAFLDNGDKTYVYGVEDRGLDKRLHVARTSLGQLTTGWQYYDGDDWSLDPGASAPVLSGVSNMFSVFPADDGVCLITQRPLSDRIMLHRAASPAGPWHEGTDIAEIPDPGPDRMAYNALAHPELSAPGELLLSYNVIALSQDGLYASADAYRPRFLIASG